MMKHLPLSLIKEAPNNTDYWQYSKLTEKLRDMKKMTKAELIDALDKINLQYMCKTKTGGRDKHHVLLDNRSNKYA
jgi:hypothetical protein